jgi:hypothetical protein
MIFGSPARTLLQWHAHLVARHWSQRQSGRPPTSQPIRALVLRMARENSTAGYRRIHSELVGLGHHVAASTVWTILKTAGIDPAPQRSGPTWQQFLSAQATPSSRSTSPTSTPSSASPLRLTFTVTGGVGERPVLAACRRVGAT